MLINKLIVKPVSGFFQKKNFSSLSEQEKIRRDDRDARHYAPANKEWKNSVYAFNKNSLLSVTAKDKKAAAIIKSYFSMVPKSIKLSRSKRRRDWLRNSTTRQFFVSKPEIKQNNDKAIITVYTHDREKVTHLRELYNLNKWLNTNLLGWKHLKSDKKKSFKFLINKYNMDYLLSNLRKFKYLKYRKRRSILRKSFAKFQVRHIKQKLFKNTIKSFLSKKKFLINSFFYHFLRWVLFIFKIKVNVVPNAIMTIGKNNKRKKTQVLYLIISNIKKMETIRKGKKKFKNIDIVNKKIIIKGVFNLKTLININLLLLQYLIVNVNKIFSKTQTHKIYSLFMMFKIKYFNRIMRKHVRNEVLIIQYLTRLYVNKFKFHTYLPGLKSFLTNIYNKKIQLNITNLKYLHLSSDLYSEVISIKLRKRTRSLIRILKKSIKLVKTFKSNNMFLLSEKDKNSVISNIDTYFGEYNVINGNTLNVIFKKMFNKNINKDKNSMEGLNTTIKDTLASLKYKWITGLRLELAGRLTKRYAAARAVYKYNYKGTLKNLDHLSNVENKLQSPSVFLLRGDARPNSQYSFVSSKRRIGAFGVKSWISSS